MRLALLGYGRMGKAIEKIALERGHKIICKIDKNQSDGVLTCLLYTSDAADE